VVNAQYFFPCQVIANGSFYNLTALSTVQITGNSSDNYFSYFLQLCAVAPKCHESGSMACQAHNILDPDQWYGVAFPNDDVFPHFWSAIKAGPNVTQYGIELTAFGEGRLCSKYGDYRRLIVHVYCDPTQIDPPLTVVGSVVEAPTCTYTFIINHVSGCPLPIPPTIAINGGSSSSAEGVTGAGVGVGIIVGLVIASILVGGYVYWKKQKAPDKFRKVGSQGDDDKNVYVAAMPHDGPTSQTDD
jgi:hypothetical protein